MYRHLNTLLIASLTVIAYPLSSVASDDDIWEKLKNGGVVVLMRHATTVKKDNPLLRDPSCLKERNLSAQGKNDAQKVNEAFSTKGVMIEQVLASPYCRTTDTANIAFKKSQPAEFLSVLEALSQEQAEANTDTLTRKISSYSGKGVLVLVTHAPNINAVSFEIVEEGAFLVFQPMGNQDFEEIGKINLAH